MDNPQYVITTPLVCPAGSGVTAVMYYFFMRPAEAYAARRQLLASGQRPNFQKYDESFARMWKDSQIPVIEVVENKSPLWIGE